MNLCDLELNEFYFKEPYPFHYHSHSRYVLPPWMEVIIDGEKIVGIKNSYKVELGVDVGIMFLKKLEAYYYALKYKECS
jgi:hypothetical protein